MTRAERIRTGNISVRDGDRVLVTPTGVNLGALGELSTIDLDGRHLAGPAPTAYYVMRVGRLPLLPYHAPGDSALGPLAERTAAAHHAMLLANHGPVVAGADLDAAADAVEELEETARLYLLLHGHRTRPLTAGQVAELRSRFS